MVSKKALWWSRWPRTNFYIFKIGHEIKLLTINQVLKYSYVFVGWKKSKTIELIVPHVKWKE